MPKRVESPKIPEVAKPLGQTKISQGASEQRGSLGVDCVSQGNEDPKLIPDPKKTPGLQAVPAKVELQQWASTDKSQVAQTDLTEDRPAEGSANEIAATFLEQVFKPVSGDLPIAARLQREIGPDGQPILTLTHTTEHFGEQLELHYRIEVAGDAISVPEVTSLSKPNVMRVPKGGWTQTILDGLRNAWRRLTIADPLLNSRFSSKQIKLAPYQESGVEETLNSLQQKGHALTVMATATGKTLVAFKVMEQLFGADREKGRRSSGPPAIIFLVNNRIILREAEEKFHNLFKGKFKASQVYEGKEDFSGDVIFATPSSLASAERLNSLLKSKRIIAVVFDEVHHLPAEENSLIFRRVQEESINKKWDTKMLGLTATETRPDRVSVITYFGREVAFDYQVTQAWEEGFLVPMTYLAGDQDLNPHNKGPVIAGTPLFEQYKENRYADSRFRFLLSLYQKNTEHLRNKRSLILSPNIERAQTLASYFRKEGIYAITLTSQERTEDPIKFDHYYEAWKNGHWPENSPYAKERIPEVVTAVDIFREGTDAPGINFLMLWADTNSSIRFMQGIGRGLRVAPFKTQLTVVDTVGLFRKVHLLRYLATFFEAEGPQGPGVGKTPSSGSELKRQGISLGEDVTFTLKEYLAHLPEHLAARYVAYSLVPANELTKLDRFIATRAGFSSEEALNEYLDSHIQKMNSSGLTPEDARAFHDKMLPVFYMPEYRLERERPGIPLEAGNVFVFNRIYDLLSRIDSVACDGCIFQFFPEFDPKTEELTRFRAKNLATLRTRVFGLTVLGMTKKLIADCLETRKIKLDKDVELSLIDDRHEIEIGGDDASLHISFAEGKRTSMERRMSQEGERFLVGTKFRGEDPGFFQDPAIGAYLSLPSLKDKLTVSDFQREPSDFLSHLAELGLIRGEQGLRRFYNELEKVTNEYCEAVKTLPLPEISERRTRLRTLITAQGNLALVDPYELTKTRADQLCLLSNKIDEAILLENPSVSQETTELRKGFDALLETGGVRWKQNLPEVFGVEVVAYRRPKDRVSQDFSISVSSPVPAHQTGLRQQDLLIRVRPDLLGRPHAFISDEAANQLSAFYDQLDSLGCSMFLNGVVNAFEFVGRFHDGELVYIFPKDKFGTFFTDTYHRVLDSTPWYALGQLTNVEPKAAKEDLNFTFNDIKESRIDFLDPETIRSLRAMRNGASYADKLAYLYLTNYEYSHLLQPTYRAATDKLNSFVSVASSARLACESLKANLAAQMDKAVTGMKRSQALQTLFKMLEIDQPQKSLTDAQVEMTSLYQIVSFDQRSQFTAPHKVTLAFWFAELRSYVHSLKIREQEMPSSIRIEIERFIISALEDYFKEGGFSASTAQAANQLKVSIAQLNRELPSIEKTLLSSPTSAVQETSSGSAASQPPFFNEDGELLFFLSKNKTKALHIDPNCFAIKDEPIEIHSRDHVRGYVRGFKLCKACKTPQIAYWEDMEKSFRTKYGGREGSHIYKPKEAGDETK